MREYLRIEGSSVGAEGEASVGVLVGAEAPTVTKRRFVTLWAELWASQMKDAGACQDDATFVLWLCAGLKAFRPLTADGWYEET